jgi:hypothetical protein
MTHIDKKIKIPSADEVLEYDGVIVKNKETFLAYRYIEGKEKIGMTLQLSQEQLDKMIKNKIAIVL